MNKSDKKLLPMNTEINFDPNRHLWNNLNEDEKEALHVAYDESFDSNNLLTHEQVKLQHLEWLKP